MTQKLFSCMFGSRLYGTQTPTSDVDWKHIVLPDLNDLLVGRRIENKVKKTNTEKNTRNTADDVDEEFIPIQVFARHFVEGQTYALELAFAIDGDHASQTFWYFNNHDANERQDRYNGESHEHLFYQFVKELREKFLTSNIKAMMGYVVNQANLYSFKGERLNVTRELAGLFEASLKHLDPDETTEDFVTGYVAELNALAAKYPKYFRQDVYDIGGGRMKPCLVILEKTLPFTNTIAHSLNVLNALENKYGSRANQASENNVDWKATMHALRIVDEGVQLLEHRVLSLPLSTNYVEYLLSVRRGELPIDPIKEKLIEKLELLKYLETTTTLPTFKDVQAEFEAWLNQWMRKFYFL